MLSLSNPDRPKSRGSMMVIPLPNKGIEVGIIFRHFHGKAFVRGKEQMAQMTRCSIFELAEPGEKTEPKLITFGVAKCSDRDQFNKETGRKISLTRALLQGTHFLSESTLERKEDRGTIWAYYRNRNLPPPTNEENGADQPAIDGVVVNEQKLLEAENPVVH